MNSKNAFEVQCFKLLINCVYGKSMENIRKRISVKLINNSKDYLRCVSQILSHKKYLTKILL